MYTLTLAPKEVLARLLATSVRLAVTGSRRLCLIQTFLAVFDHGLGGDDGRASLLCGKYNHKLDSWIEQTHDFVDVWLDPSWFGISFRNRQRGKCTAFHQCEFVCDRVDPRRTRRPCCIDYTCVTSAYSELHQCDAPDDNDGWMCDQLWDNLSKDTWTRVFHFRSKSCQWSRYDPYRCDSWDRRH